MKGSLLTPSTSLPCVWKKLVVFISFGVIVPQVKPPDGKPGGMIVESSVKVNPCASLVFFLSDRYAISPTDCPVTVPYNSSGTGPEIPTTAYVGPVPIVFRSE